MSLENPNWGFEDNPQLPTYDVYTQFCDALNEDFGRFDAIEIPSDIQAMRRFLRQDPLPRIGLVYTMSDSKLYDAFAQIEGLSDRELDEDAEKGKLLAGSDQSFSGEDFVSEVGGLATHLQSEMDSQKPMDVTVQVHHVYESPFEETLSLVKDKASELGGKILNEDELSPVQRATIKSKLNGIPYNHSTGFIVRFESIK